MVLGLWKHTVALLFGTIKEWKSHIMQQRRPINTILNMVVLKTKQVQLFSNTNIGIEISNTGLLNKNNCEQHAT